MKTSQLNWTIKQLEKNGEISRNQCLKHYFSRLGARISDLKKSGWKFDTERRRGDYVYKVTFQPK